MGNQNTIKAKIDLAAEITQYQSSIADFQKELNKLHLPLGIKDQINSIITDLKDGINKLEKETASGEINPFNKDKINKAFKEIENKYSALIKKAQSQNIQTAELESSLKILNKLADAEKDYRKQITDANRELQKREKKLNDLTEKRDDAVAERDSKKIARDLARDAVIKAQSVADAAQKELNKKEAAKKVADKAVKDSKKNYTGANWDRTKEAKTLLASQAQAVKEYNDQLVIAGQATQALTDAKNAQTQAEKEATDAIEAAKIAQDEYDKNNVKLTQDIDAQRKAVDKLSKGTSTTFRQIKKDLIDFSQANGINWGDFGIDLNKIRNINDLKDALDKVKQSSSNAADIIRDKMSDALDKCGNAGKTLESKIEEGADAVDELTSKGKDLDDLKNKLISFFGVSNAINLFKRAMRSAYETIKDLDKVMTNMAVVTSYQISDLWEQLPEYTARANELGVTIHDAYESMTIFLQQGLEENRALAISTETLKMARIAGLDASDATDRMTNALRGFNMELNGLSAQRVDDVYNNLAAKSAANVDQISNAMTKVASLAHSANMEFETTAAFLTQIIETTRESSETAGTALKTVVARFSEVKKLYSTGELLGADEEGEEIDVNKISAALRTAGINLNEYFTGVKGLDQIFIELASKWDHLDEVQKRYIATMAAGSRQQSRFLAMMSDYKRTQELVGYATNANGFANEQYEKTLESVETALNRLQNAWNTFTMGFANNELVVGIIKILTNLVDAFDTLTTTLPGVAGSFVKLTIAVTAFKLVSAATSTALGNLTKGLGKLDAATGTTTRLFTGLGGNLLKTLSSLKKFVAIAGLVTAAIAAIVAIFKAVQRNSPEGKLKAAKEQLDKFAKSAQDAKEKVDNLNTSFNSLGDKTETLAKLTKGTREWKEAVQDINTTVVDLLQSFPELIDYVTNKNGVLGFSAEGMEKVLKLYQDRALEAMAAKMEAEVVVNERTVEKLRSKIKLSEETSSGAQALRSNASSASAVLKDIMGVSDNGAQVLYNQAAVLEKAARDINIAFKNNEQDIIKSFQEGGIKTLGDFQERIYELTGSVESYSITKEEFNQVRAYVKELQLLEKSTETLRSSLVSTALATSDLEDKENSYATNFLNYGDKVDKLVDGLTLEDGTSLSNIDEWSKDLIKATYQDLTGKTEEQIEKEETDKLDWKNAIISIMKSRAIKNLGESVGESIANSFNEQVKRLYSREGGLGLTIGDIYDFDVNAAWQALGAEGQAQYKSKEEFENETTDLIDKAKEAASEAIDYFKTGFNEQYQSLITRLGPEAANDLKKNIEKVVLTSGQTAGELVLQDIQEVTKDMNPEEVQSFVNQINSINWKDKDEIESFKNNLVELGFKIDVESEAFKSLTEDLIESAKAIKKVNIDSLNKKITSLASILDKINKESTRSFSDDEYESITKADSGIKDYFVKTITGWEYVGSSMDRLVDALNKNTEAEIQEAEAQLEAKIGLAEIWDGLGEETKKKSKKDLFGDLFAHAKLNGVDLSKLGIFGLTNETRYQDLTDEQKEAFYDEMASKILGQTATLKAQRENTLQSAVALKAATRNPVENVAAMAGAPEADQETIRKAILAQAQVAGVARTEIDKYIESWEKADEKEKISLTTKLAHVTMSYQLAEKWDIEKQALDELAASLMKTEELEEDQIGLAYDLALSQMAFSKGLQTIVSNFSNWDGILWDSADGLKKAKEGTAEYATAINTLKGSLQQVLGTDVEFDEELFNANLPEILDYVKKISAAESEEIANNLVSELDTKLRGWLDFEKLIKNIDFDNEELKNEWSTLQTFFNNNSLMLHMNDEEFAKELAAFLTKLGIGVEDANKLFDALGFDVQIEYETVPVYEQFGYEGKMVDKQIIKSIQYKPKEKSRNIDASTLTQMSDNGKKGKTDKPNYWKNPYDELYNLNEKINESLRTREALERRYDKLLKQRTSSLKNIRDAYYANIAQLRTEADLEKQMAAGRLRQIHNIGNEYYVDSDGNRKTFGQLGVTKYAHYDEQQQTIVIDWAGLEAIEANPAREKEGAAAEAYISQLEEWVQGYEEVRDKLWDIEDKIEEIRDEVIQSYGSFEERVLDAVVNKYQKQIDEYQSLSDTIKESNDKIISNLQESIALSRQIRDNTKTEEDIADKEQRLAYLQRDTSGANDLEAMKLQKEIEDARENYQDTLIDQAVEQLSKDNEKAALQREQQIEQMNKTLEWEQQMGLLWNEVHDYINKGFDGGKNEIISGSALEELLKKNENFQALSELGKELWTDEFTTALKEAWIGLKEAEAKYNKDFNNDGKIETSPTQAAIDYTTDGKASTTPYATPVKTTGGTGNQKQTSTTPTKTKDQIQMEMAAALGADSPAYMSWLKANYPSDWARNMGFGSVADYEKYQKEFAGIKDQTIQAILTEMNNRTARVDAESHGMGTQSFKQQNHSITINGMTFNVGPDDDGENGNGWLDEAAQAWKAYVQTQLNML